MPTKSRQITSDLKGDRRSIKMFGGRPDGKFISDSAITSGADVLTTTSGKFSASDVGKTITVDGAGPGGGILKTTIAGFTDSNTVALTLAATTTVLAAAGKFSWWGTDNSPAINAAIQAISTFGGGELFFPFGIYMVSSPILMLSNIHLVGEHCSTRYSFSPGNPFTPLLLSIIKTSGDFPANGIIIDGRGVAGIGLHWMEVLGDGTSIQTQTDATTTALALGNANQPDNSPTGNHTVLERCSFGLSMRNVWAKLQGSNDWRWNNFGTASYISIDFEKYAGNDSTYVGNNINSNNWLQTTAGNPFTDLYTGTGLRLGIGCTAQSWIGGKFEYNGTAILLDKGSWGCHFTGVHFDANSKWHVRFVGNPQFDDIQTIDHRFVNCRFNGGSYFDTSNGFPTTLNGLDAHVLLEAPYSPFLASRLSAIFVGCSFKSQFYNGTGGLYELDPNYPKWPQNNVVASRVTGTPDVGLPILELAFNSNDCRYGAVKSGTASVSGTIVTWVSGAQFDSSWKGRTFWFNLYNPVCVASVTSSTSLTLVSSLGVQPAAPYYIDNNRIFLDPAFSQLTQVNVTNCPGILPSYFRQSSEDQQTVYVLEDLSGNPIYTLSKAGILMNGFILGDIVGVQNDQTGVLVIGRFQPPGGLNYTGAVLDFNSPDFATNQPTLASIRFLGTEKIQINTTGMQISAEVGIGGAVIPGTPLAVYGFIGLDNGTVVVFPGTGSPEGNLTAPPGSLFLRKDTGDLYIKQSGVGNTGWILITTNYWFDISPLLSTNAIGTLKNVGIQSNPNTASGIIFSVGGPSQLQAVGINRLPGTGLDLDVNGNSELHGSVKLTARNASRPLKTDASKVVTDGKISGTTANDFDMSPIAASHFVGTDGSVLTDAGAYGVTATINTAVTPNLSVVNGIITGAS